MKGNSLLALRHMAMLFILLMSASLSAQAFFWSGYESETVTYTPPGWPEELKGDLYLPKDAKAKGPLPTMLLLHGGAWRQGDRGKLKKAGRYLAEQDYAAFVVDYRHAPEYRYPAQLEDTQQALRWLKRNAGQYGLDMNRVGLWGYSAGAHLAALLGVQPLMTDLPPVHVVVAGGTPADLRSASSSSVRDFLGGPESKIPEVYKEASPAAHVQAGLPAFFLYHGTADDTVPLPQAERFAKALEQAGVPVTLVKLEGLDHREASKEARELLPQILSFVQKHIDGTARATAGTP